MVSGDIHDELTKTNEEPVLKTTLLTASIFTQMLAILSKSFNHLRVVGVVGNHGRL